MAKHKLRSPSRRDRSNLSHGGASLVELVVCMTGGAAVFGLAVGAVEQTMRLSTQARVQAEHQQTLARLSQQLRADIRQATAAALSSELAELQLTFDRPDPSDQPTKVLYKAGAAKVVRQASHPANPTVAREEYRLATDVQVRWAALEGNTFGMTVVRSVPEGERLERQVVAKLNRLTGLQLLKKEQP